ncbi:MAG TPA: class F sortase [Actinoplanes sp.]|nr:class F sortase [Actinoplanes sp.]
MSAHDDRRRSPRPAVGSVPARRGGVRIRDPKAAAFALVLAVLGTLTTTLGLTTEDSAPPPAAQTAEADPTSPRSPAASGGPGGFEDPGGTDGVDAGMGRSVPVRLRIPKIGVDTALMSLGLRPDGTLQVPPLRGDAPAGWYRGSPTPGEVGASVLVGHVDTARDGPAVFFRLREVEVGDPIAVRRKDGTVARFEVSRVAVFAKREFPSAEVYAAPDRPGLRLITCGGVFDRGAGSYESNVVVFADAVT